RGLVRALREPDPAGRGKFLVGIDLDGFKNVNDMRGHDVGDEVLVGAARRRRAGLGEPYEVDKGTVFLSASVGVAGHPAPDDTGELMRDADLALRYAKLRGKNRVERYEVRYDELLRRRSTLENELRHAVDREELRLVFQPVV